MKLDPLKMILYGVVIFIVIVILTFYSFKISAKIIKDDFLEESIGISKNVSFHEVKLYQL